MNAKTYTLTYRVRLKNRRGQEIAKALTTDILPIKSNSAGKPLQVPDERPDGSLWCYVADPDRLTIQQIQRLATSLARKYDSEPVGSVPLEWCNTNGMINIISKNGFTVPIEDCDVMPNHIREEQSQTSFLDRAQPRDDHE